MLEGCMSISIPHFMDREPTRHLDAHKGFISSSQIHYTVKVKLEVPGSQVLMYLCPTELTLISPPYILFSHLELSPHIWHPQFHFLSCSLRYIYTLTVTFSQAILPLNGRLGFHISSVFTIVGKWAIYIIFFFFFAVPRGIQDLPNQGIKPLCPAFKVQSLNHWPREVQEVVKYRCTILNILG